MVSRCDSLADVLLVVDLQAPLLEVIHERDRVVSRACFLIEVAHELGVPVLATEQAPDRLGGTVEAVKTALGHIQVFAKSEFSAGANPAVQNRLVELSRPSVILVGVETHICVCGSALDLIVAGYRVTVCPDATSSRTLEAHKLGMERIRDAGAMPAHTESVAYEWLKSSAHPRFKSVLDLVKVASLGSTGR